MAKGVKMWGCCTKRSLSNTEFENKGIPENDHKPFYRDTT